MIGRIYRNEDGARFRIVGRLGAGWVSHNLDRVGDVPPGALWRRREIPPVMAVVR